MQSDWWAGQVCDNRHPPSLVMITSFLFSLILYLHTNLQLVEKQQLQIDHD